LVTLSWVRERLAGPDDGGGLGQISYAFFDAPDGFRVRIGPASGDPANLRLVRSGLRWRISAVYY
jgi:hypothetical protein